MKLSKIDLQNVFSIAKQNFVNDTKGDLDNQEFASQCYAKALATVLHLEIELPQPRLTSEPVE